MFNISEVETYRDNFNSVKCQWKRKFTILVVLTTNKKCVLLSNGDDFSSLDHSKCSCRNQKFNLGRDASSVMCMRGMFINIFQVHNIVY